MLKEHEVSVTVEVTFQTRVAARTCEAAENEAESLVEEALEGLAPGPVYIVGAPQFIESEAIEITDDAPEDE